MAAFDIAELVAWRVRRSCASPAYTTFLEEATRHERTRWAATERRAATATTKPRSAAANASRLTSHLLLPHPVPDAPVTRVALIGGTGFLGKFIAEECRKKGMALTVLARNGERAARIFGPIADGSRERGQRERQGYVVTSPASGAAAAASTLRIVEGDARDPAAVREAVRDADIVFALASARGDALWRRLLRGGQSCASVDVGGLQAALDASRLVDAHLVALTPTAARRRRIAPAYFWWNGIANQWPYLASARARERLLLADDGEIGSAVQSLRFTLFRVRGVVHPALPTTLAFARNDAIADPMAVVRLESGDVGARALCTALMRAVCFHRGALGARLDVAPAAAKMAMTAASVRSEASLEGLDLRLQEARHPAQSAPTAAAAVAE